MELDELKTIWKHHDSQLENHLKLNEQILRQLKLTHAGNEFRRLMNFEIVSAVGEFLAVLVIVYLAVPDSQFSLHASLGYLSGGMMLMYLVFSMIRLAGFSKLCSFDESVVKVQKELAFQKRRMLRFRRIELFTLPVCFITCIPFLAEVIYNFDMLQFPGRYAAGVAVSSVVAIPLVLWLYRVFYDRRITSAETMLKSISDFEEMPEEQEK